MAQKTKSLLLCFLLGAIGGLAISPWANTQPQQIFRSSQPLTYAQATSSPIKPKEMPTTHNTLAFMFDQFDTQQQMTSQATVTTQSKFKVLGTQIENNNISFKTGKVTIAIIGDSMVDTMETNLPYLEKALKTYYPNMQFNLLNYGIGGQNIEKGEERIALGYTYKDRNYPPISSSGADIIIIESFAYNPLGAEETSHERYKEKLSGAINSLKKSGTPVLFLATIAPIKRHFGEGPGGVNWPSDIAWNHATTIQSYIEAGIQTAQAENLAIIDAYHPTLSPNGEGKPEFVSTHDGIHPSVSGHRFVANLIAQKLFRSKLF